MAAIAGGDGQTLALKGDGTAWAWGNNSYGQLGEGTTTSRSTPVQVVGAGGTGYLTGVSAVSAGRRYSLALKGDGSVWAWGDNSQGQLGDGTTGQSTTPVQVKGAAGTGYLSGVGAIEAGYEHGLALSSSGSGSSSYQYGYDRLYRLTGVSGGRSASYVYDPVGNRSTRDATSYSYDRADRITSAGTVSYTVDANGNLAARGADSFGYDQANRLKSATVNGAASSYVYDGDGKRASKTVGGTATSYVYDVNASLPVLLDDGTRKYVWGPGLAYAVDRAGNPIVYHSDGLGSVRALTDGSGNVVQSYRYDEYGIVLSSQGTVQPFGYTGEQIDDYTKFVYLRSRFYDPEAGRFLSRDPIVSDYSDPRSINRYGYARNSPATLVDPSGHVVWLPIIVGAVIGGAIGGVQAAQTTNDPWKIAAGVGIGAAAGGASGIALGGALVTAGMGVLAGGASNVATQAIVQGRGLGQIDVGSAMISGAAGGLGAGGAMWAGRWIGTSRSSLASWIRGNSAGWDDEAIEAGLSGVITAAVDLPLQAAWARTPSALRSDLSAPHGSATLGLRSQRQPSK